MSQMYPHFPQAELDRQVARRLGESVREIARRGFSLFCPLDDDTEVGVLRREPQLPNLLE